MDLVASTCAAPWFWRRLRVPNTSAIASGRNRNDDSYRRLGKALLRPSCAGGQETPAPAYHDHADAPLILYWYFTDLTLSRTLVRKRILAPSIVAREVMLSLASRPAGWQDGARLGHLLSTAPNFKPDHSPSLGRPLAGYAAGEPPCQFSS